MKLLYILLYSLVFSLNLFSYEKIVDLTNRTINRNSYPSEPFNTADFKVDTPEYIRLVGVDSCPKILGSDGQNTVLDKTLFILEHDDITSRDETFASGNYYRTIFTLHYRTYKKCYYECGDKSKPPVSPLSAVKFPDDINGTCETPLPPQYKEHTRVCYTEPCATDPIIEFIYAEHDPDYRPDGDNDGDGTPNKCDPDDPYYLKKYDCDGDGNLNTPFPDLVSSNLSSSGSHSYRYADGSYQACSVSTGTCDTYNGNGVTIPNIPIDGQVYPTVEGLVNGRVIKRMLSIAGLTIGALSGGTAILGYGVLSSSTVGALGSLGSHSMVAGLYGLLDDDDNLYSINTPDNDNIGSTEKKIKITLAPADFTPANSTQTLDKDSNPVLTTTNPDNEKVKITTKPENIEIEKTSSNGTVTTTTIPKTALTTPTSTNDFSEQNNLPPVNYKTTVKQPDKINNNGTIKRGQQTTTNNVYSSSNSGSTTTSSSTTQSYDTPNAVNGESKSTSTTTNADASTSTSTQDLRAITIRLDQIISQNSLTNNTLKDLNKESTQEDILKKLEEILKATLNDSNSSNGTGDNDTTTPDSNSTTGSGDTNTTTPDSNTTHSGDTNTTTPDSNSTTGSGESNTTTPDSNSTTGSGDTNTTTPDSNTTHSGDTNTTTPDSNSTTGSGESNTTTPDSNISIGIGVGTPGTDTNNTNNENDSNTTGGWDEDTIKDKIKEQFTKKYTIFNVSSCGSPVFGEGIDFMGYVHIENPLPIMHAYTEEYYDGFKIFVILTATLMGLLTIFRR